MVDICLVLALDVLPKLEEEAKGRMLAGKPHPTQIIAEGHVQELALCGLTACVVRLLL